MAKKKRVLAVQDAMLKSVPRATVPIGIVVGDDNLQHLASGTLFVLCGQPYLVTCHHVAIERLKGTLAMSLGHGAPTIGLINPFQTGDMVNDVAITRLGKDWLEGGTRKLLSAHQLAEGFNPPLGEVFFVYGYPAFLEAPDLRAHYDRASGRWRSVPAAITRPLWKLPPGYDPRIYFALKYSAYEMLSVTQGKGIATPYGLSGSAVWQTNISVVGEEEWSAECARIVGIAVAWERDHSAMICMKVDIVRQFLLRALRQEAAYFRWANRGSPRHDDWSDWFWAEGAISDLE